MKTRSAALLCAFVGLHFLGGCAAQTLPAPSLDLPAEPKIAPTVITAGGQRLLLNQTDVTVNFDPSTRRLTSNHPGWWIINYPLERIRNFDGPVAALSQILFDTPQEYVRNWYLKTPGTPTVEPAEPTGPAPIDLSPNPAFYVDQRAANASDGGPGSSEAPLRTIGEAVRRAEPGAIIQVRYGIYRESVDIKASGSAEKPIRLEGVRSEQGLPVVDGNDLFPANAWTPTEWPAVYRANFGPSYEGLVSLGSAALIERSLPSDLRPGEFANNRGSREFLRPAVDSRIRPVEGGALNGRNWRLVRPDATGMMNLNDLDPSTAANSTYWASTWVWVDPLSAAFDPNKPAARAAQNLIVEGTFRAFRFSGAEHNQQVNKYRLWVNGDLLPSAVFSTTSQLELLLPHPDRRGGTDDEWSNFPFREGWNHLLFQLDTTVMPQDAHWRFRFPSELGAMRTSARTPGRLNSNAEGTPGTSISEYLLLGPFPAQPDRGVYVRLPNDANPNAVSLAMAARGSILTATGDYVEIRGFEFRHGAQYQQHGQVTLDGAGTLLEGSIMIGSEVAGVVCRADRDGAAPPVVIRNNWILDPGNVGFGCSGSSDALTPSNLNLHAAIPGRSPVLFENNYIRNANWAGYPLGWAAGGSKSVRISGMVFRYNTIIGSSGQAIWLDWENYGNRIDGNLVRDPFQLGIGIEASPGPNLVSNNVLAGFRAKANFDSSMIASWDSSNTWAVNNTVNGRWNGGKGWIAPEIAYGIDLGGGGDRTIRFGPQKPPKLAYLNNIIVGFDRAIHIKTGDVGQANYSESGAGGTVLGRLPEFKNFAFEDYRLQPASALNRAGVRNSITDSVRHDFHGLMRLRAFPNSVGAFRNEPSSTAPNEPVMEIEYEDGVQKLINSGAPPVANNAVPVRDPLARNRPK